MKFPTQRILCFLGGVAIMIAYNYARNDSVLSELRMVKDACSFVWEEHGKPTITTNTGYWKRGVIECLVFDNGTFRNLTAAERTSYEAALETHIHD
ncbi:hypothetical protein CKC67_24520 [Salmonella enterica]|nr:hypothetical protein [Salmonella enterica]EJB9096176.1 hypothetical protein [Salmonella enterica]EJB9133502.1 hypothetical protein [Salmonella enterica]EJC0271772.1 hypothetical protein [Salmonella enterica]EJC0499484.1 hypothetical protein [Salmonella enterica]